MSDNTLIWQTLEMSAATTSAGYLVVVNELLQLVSVDDNMKTAHLCQAELLPIYTCETHLRGEIFMFERLKKAKKPTDMVTHQPLSVRLALFIPTVKEKYL